MTSFRTILLTCVSVSLLAPVTAAATVQPQQQAQPAQQEALPLCRLAEPGERCRTRNGEERVRRGRRQNFGGDQPGFVRPEVDDEVVVQFEDGDPDRPVVSGQTRNNTDRPAAADDGREGFTGDEPTWVRRNPADAFNGGDVGFATGDQDAPVSTAMESDFSDDDDEGPQVPQLPTNPRNPDDTGGRTEPAGDPEEDEDCEWNNPEEGPDQEFCDE